MKAVDTLIMQPPLVFTFCFACGRIKRGNKYEWFDVHLRAILESAYKRGRIDLIVLKDEICPQCREKDTETNLVLPRRLCPDSS